MTQTPQTRATKANQAQQSLLQLKAPPFGALFLFRTDAQVRQIHILLTILSERWHTQTQRRHIMRSPDKDPPPKIGTVERFVRPNRAARATTHSQAIWSDQMHIYLREQFTNAATSKERAAALRLACALVRTG